MKFPKLSKRVLLGSVAVVGVAALATAAIAAGDLPFVGKSLKDKMQAHFPNTPITSVDCDGTPAGLCEVVAGKNIFYTTRNGRFAVVGSVLDLNEKVDLTDQRMRQLAAMGAAEGRIQGVGPGAAGAAPAAAPSPDRAAPGPAIRVTLPKANAIVHNPGAPLKMTVFTDMNCSFCRRLHDDLRGVTDIEITEYPIAFLGADSHEKAKLALCANDRSAAVDAIYRGGEVRTSGDCAAAEAALQANIAFAQQNNIQGTPMIIRADGMTNSGWMEKSELRAFLQASN
ncbi:MAG: DsbC family protein [Brevundimonas aurantiaca]|jgi:thiol:disulfide interchange protein DsbC|uniref:DsbC family protein n=1 Tax=Brevundimonas aurantiaca TaxID=74316 RepID=UPI0040332860